MMPTPLLQLICVHVADRRRQACTDFLLSLFHLKKIICATSQSGYNKKLIGVTGTVAACH